MGDQKEGAEDEGLDGFFDSEDECDVRLGGV